jgi:hypothetical protein
MKREPLFLPDWIGASKGPRPAGERIIGRAGSESSCAACPCAPSRGSSPAHKPACTGSRTGRPLRQRLPDDSGRP